MFSFIYDSDKLMPRGIEPRSLLSCWRISVMIKGWHSGLKVFAERITSSNPDWNSQDGVAEHLRHIRA